MEAKELRIGNYVTENDRLIHIHDGFGIDHAYNFEPIPLTEDWLLKFGFSFKEDDLGFYFKWELKDDKDEFGFYVPGDEHPHRYKYYCGGWNGEIKYVHQLQNLYFALTGEELTSIATPTI